MAKQDLNLGTVANDHTGDSIRVAGGKINNNFAELYAALGNGSVLTVSNVAKTGSYNDLLDKPAFNGFNIVSVPTSLTSPGSPRDVAIGAIDNINYLFVCTSTDTWKIIPLRDDPLVQVSAPNNLYGKLGDRAGLVAYDTNNFYYCIADYVDNSTNIWKTIPWGGSGGGSSFDQDLNTTNSVEFAEITVAGSVYTPLGSVVGVGIDNNTYVGLEAVADAGVILRATDSNSNGVDWKFRQNGVLDLPGSGGIFSDGQGTIAISNATLGPEGQAPNPSAVAYIGGVDDVFRISYGSNPGQSFNWKITNEGTTVLPGGIEIANEYIQHPSTGNFISLNNDTGADIICSGELRLGTNFSDIVNRKFWRLNPNGTTTVPGAIYPDTDVAYDLGSPTKRFKDLYLSGNTIDLGGAKISVDLAGNVIVPGINKKITYTNEILDYRATPADSFNGSPLYGTEADWIVVDQVFYQMAYHAAEWGLSMEDYVADYGFTLVEGSISEITVGGRDYPNAISEQVDFAALNEDNMWVIPAEYNGQPVDLTDASLLQSIFDDLESGAQMLDAGVSSLSEAGSVQLYYQDILDTPVIPQDISDLSDNQNLLVGITSYNDLTNKPTRNVNVPLLNTGAAGDLKGDVAVDDTYLYYCINNYGTISGTQVTIQGGGGNAYVAINKTDYPTLLTDFTANSSGWILLDPEGNAVGINLVENNGFGDPNKWAITLANPTSLFNYVTGYIQPPNTTNVIWKRVAWASDTW